MFTPPLATEMVYQIPSETEGKILQDYFHLFYTILAEGKLIPDAVCEKNNDIQRYLSGIPEPYNNAVVGVPAKNDLWDQCISEQMSFFRKSHMPFIWYLEEKADENFKNKLLAYGFQHGGIFKGIIGMIDRPITDPIIPQDCTLELVGDESAMDEFSEFVCNTLGFQEASREVYKKLLWEATKNEEHTMYHWLARKEGKPVSTLSTLIKGNVVALWHGSSLPEMRGQGLCTALSQLALQHAASKGCCIGISYLLSEELADSINSKLGSQTKWRVQGFISP